VKYPLKIGIWGCMLKNHKIIFEFYENTINSDKYIKIICNNIIPLISKNSNLLFQQDNASCHVSNKTITFFARNNVEIMIWPPNSPDLNPIENCWYLLKKRIGLVYCKNKEEFKKIIKDALDNFEIEIINKLTDSMNNRIVELFKKDFNSINY